MSDDKLITISNSEKGWLVIGIGLGIILTFIFLYLYTYLPLIKPMQLGVLIGFVAGIGMMYLLQKIN